MYDRPFFLAPIIMEVQPEFEVENIWRVILREKGRERKRENKMKSQSIEKGEKAKQVSI